MEIFNFPILKNDCNDSVKMVRKPSGIGRYLSKINRFKVPTVNGNDF